MKQTPGLHPTKPQPKILCLAHLGWDYVWQRPQHILSRLARHYPVMYVNEPELTAAAEREPYLKPIADDGNVSAWQPMFPDRAGVLEQWRENYVQLVQSLLAQQGERIVLTSRNASESSGPLILWFYTPTPYYFLDHIPADLVVYDVMDELANFKNAAPDLREREARLLAQADVIFTGGRSLYEARKRSVAGLHPDGYQPDGGSVPGGRTETGSVYLFPSGVEPEHFAQALRSETAVAAEIAHLGDSPILGYYGVIDERIDLDLLNNLSTTHPEWQIVMVGPVAKLEESDLPRRPNIHYTGRQPYAQLPTFLKGFDVCLMPFAMNEATRNISPTKTLEYMAAHKPIVSTPVPDVVQNWSDVVRIAADPAGFADAVKQALQETTRQRQQRARREAAHLACNTWDHIVQEMKARIDAALQQRRQETTKPVSSPTW